MIHETFRCRDVAGIEKNVGLKNDDKTRANASKRYSIASSEVHLPDNATRCAFVEFLLSR